MKLVKDQITPMQLFFSTAAFGQGSTLLSSFFVGVLKQDSWFGILVGYLISLLLLSLYLYLLSKHPGKNLMEMNEEVFGKVVGKGISVLYILYFFSLVVLNTNDMDVFITGFIMPETPPIAIAALFALVCILAVRKGANALVRYSAILSVSQLVVTVTFTLLLIYQMKPENLLPVLDIPAKRIFQGVHTVVALPFGELIALTMFIPCVADQKKVRGAYLGGFTLSASVMMAIVLGDILVLGNLLEYLTLPRYETARLINVLDVFNRMETLYALILIILRFFKVSILLYAVVLGIAQVFNLRNYVPLVSILGALAALYSVFVWHSAAEGGEWGANTAAVYASFFNILLPLLTLGVYSVRALITKRRVRPA